MVIELELIVLILLFIFSLYESIKHKTFGVFVSLLQLSLLVDITIYKADKIVREIQYKQFRDSNYTDFSKNKNYRHWLIDNPKIKKG